MTLTELEEAFPALLEYTKNMPIDIRSRCTVRTHPAGSLIHQKNMPLPSFGIVADGKSRVINEFENGNVYMIESNEAIDFIGEVTILADKPNTSVTIEAVTTNIVAYISRKDAERWLCEDMNILRLTAKHTATKLYRSSYTNGAKLFYPPSFLLLDYIVRYGDEQAIEKNKVLTINKTRQILCEELGINIKTLDRTIRQLKKEEYFDTCKGKITFSYEQYLDAIDWLKNSLGH